MKHDFHFVINSMLKKEIIGISKIINENTSKTIIYILNIIFPIIDNYYYSCEEGYNGGYEFINADSDIHVYLKEIDYRKLRHICNNMYIFSIAKIIRFMIKLFIKGINKYGFNKFLKIMKRYKNINIIKFNRVNKWGKYKLYKYGYCNKSINDYFRLTFSNDYTLLSLEFI